MRKKNLAKLFDIFCTLNEAHGDKVKIASGTEFNVSHIFFSNDITTKISVRKIETLAAHNKTVIFNTNTNSSVANNFDNLGTDFTVEHEERFTNFHAFSKVVLNWKDV